MEPKLTSDAFLDTMDALAGAPSTMVRSYIECLHHTLGEEWRQPEDQDVPANDYGDLAAPLSTGAENVVRFISTLFDLDYDRVRLNLSNMAVAEQIAQNEFDNGG